MELAPVAFVAKGQQGLLQRIGTAQLQSPPWTSGATCIMPIFTSTEVALHRPPPGSPPTPRSSATCALPPKGLGPGGTPSLRGDSDPISIGENTNIRNGSVLHTDEGVPLPPGPRRHRQFIW